MLVGLLVLPGTLAGTDRGSSASHVAGRGAIASGSTIPATTSFDVADGATVRALANHHSFTLHDTLVPGAASGGVRHYRLLISVSAPLPTTSVRIWTNAVYGWSTPGQLPWGEQSLPPLSEWSWWVWSNGVNQTHQWAVNSGGTELTRSTFWVNRTYLVFGVAHPTIDLVVHTAAADGTRPTGTGFTVNNDNLGLGGPIPRPTKDPDYANLGGALHPRIIRFGLTSVGSSTSWNPLTNAPKFDFANFDSTMKYGRAVGAAVVLTLSVGTWGDGNLLPLGMPLNLGLPVHLRSSIGFFPTVHAYVTYIDAIVNHTLNQRETVRYWNIGNEMPLVNATVVAAYIKLFNAAASVIHSRYPSALVGSDVMMDRGYLAQFARGTRGVGFLSFHWYPAAGLCVVHGAYCPPAPGGRGSTDPGILGWGPNLSAYEFYPPRVAQANWHWLTGTWLPVLDTESNLNGFGGNPLNYRYGTDPRLQSAFGGTWLTSALITSSVENVSAFNYFMLTGPNSTPRTVTARYGGWGFGMTTEGTSDNDTRYAPYWAMQMWGQAFPANAQGLQVSGIDYYDGLAYAARNTSGLAVMIANEVDVPVTYSVTLSGHTASPVRVSILDGASYVESYNPAVHRVSLVKDSVRTVAATANPVRFTIQGYGVALVVERPTQSPFGSLGPAPPPTSPRPGGSGSPPPPAGSTGAPPPTPLPTPGTRTPPAPARPDAPAPRTEGGSPTGPIFPSVTLAPAPRSESGPSALRRRKAGRRT